jgi:HSP20 family protein
MNSQVATKQQNLPQIRTDPFPRLMDWFESLIPADTAMRFNVAHPMRIEEYMRDGSLIVRAELPGIDPVKDVEVTVSEGLLTIRGERKEERKEERRSEFYYGSFVRTVSLPTGVDQSNVEAEYKDGILEVRVAMPDQGSAPAQIPVKRAG